MAKAFDDQQKFSRTAFVGMFRNSVRLMSIIWKDKPALSTLLGLSVFVVAILPSLRAGALALLIN